MKNRSCLEIVELVLNAILEQETDDNLLTMVSVDLYNFLVFCLF